MEIRNSQSGFIVSIMIVFLLAIFVTIALSMSTLVFYRQKVATNLVKSTQSYYAAESGIEDSLLRLKNNPQIPPVSYNLSVNNATAAVTIPAIVAGSRAIASNGNTSGIIRKVETVYSIDAQGVSFNYGAQVGAGGLIMNNGSIIKGNVFSNGNISGNGTIDNNVIVAGNGHNIKDVRVKEDALSYSCLANSTIEGDLTYVMGGTRTCKVNGSISTRSSEIPTQPLPISQSQIQEWKNEAAVEVISGNITILNGQTKSYGPVKITGSLTISNNATLNMTGTIWVVGDISASNNGKIKLDGSYGSLGGIIITDKNFTISNNGILQGSGQSGSNLLVLSTSSADPAISINNNAAGAIFYASNGGISVSNNTQVKELTGYKITMQNNSVIQYETGLASLFFSSGPSGGWQITSWQEK